VTTVTSTAEFAELAELIVFRPSVESLRLRRVRSCVYAHVRTYVRLQPDPVVVSGFSRTR